MTDLNGTTLPDDIIWKDEFSHTPIQQSIKYTRGGRQVIRTRKLTKGRPITLDCQWLTKTDIDNLKTYEDLDSTMVLTLPDARTFNVKFRHHEPPPIEAQPLIEYGEYVAADQFQTTLKLIEV